MYIIIRGNTCIIIVSVCILDHVFLNDLNDISIIGQDYWIGRINEAVMTMQRCESSSIQMLLEIISYNNMQEK